MRLKLANLHQLSSFPRAVFCTARNTFILCNKDQIWGVGSLKKGILMLDYKNPEEIHHKRYQLKSVFHQEEIFQKKEKKNDKQAEKDSDCFLKFFHLKYFCKNRILYLSASTNHVIAISKSGYAYSWGANNYYQLGIGMSSDY